MRTTVARLGELAVPAAVVAPQVTMAEVERLLRDDPDCLGVATVVADVIYLLHRARLDQVLAQAVGRERARLGRRPLVAFLDEPATVLPYEMAWDDAARAAMARPTGLKAVPVVVELADGRLALAPIGPLVEHLSAGYAALAMRDSLTGLGNRRGLREMLDSLGGDRPVAVLVLDLDRFKEINEALGHHGGDEVLKHVGRVLKDGFECAYRLGGDEFVVVLPGHDPAGLDGETRRLLDRLRGPVTVDGVLIPIEASLGIAYGTAAGELLARADTAMFAAKRDRTEIEWWRPELRTDQQTDLRLQGELRTAIAGGQLVLHYQPLVDCTGVMRSVEALVRWQHPVRGLLAPGTFLPQAERSTVITDLTDRVLADAIAQAARWRADGLDLPVAVNLAAPVLAHDRFIAVIRDLLERHGVPPTGLIVEITESAVMTKPERSARWLAAIRDLGVRIAMDDFGTGYTSLALLTQLPLDELKLDRTFVNRIHHPQERVIVEAVARMAGGLGLTLVAEGVEDQMTADILRGFGFDLLQGFHFGRPVPADRLAVRSGTPA
ncbi:EAL domain-containing protein [Actinoplanes sp. NPDC051411]|uniref:putative bifunctional diguanylate cyclase/phosphodiesterase n=1 Tax=Actinoplanes sp. NPDC051411 TaxID=3155522 RepID=UPI003418A452